MRISIEVKDRNEGDAIKRALEDPETRAYVVVTGILAELPDDAARSRVLHCSEILLSSAPATRSRSRGNGSELALRLEEGSDTGE